MRLRLNKRIGEMTRLTSGINGRVNGKRGLDVEKDEGIIRTIWKKIVKTPRKSLHALFAFVHCYYNLSLLRFLHFFTWKNCFCLLSMIIREKISNMKKEEIAILFLFIQVARQNPLDFLFWNQVCWFKYSFGFCK